MTLIALQRDMRAWLVREDTDAADRLGELAAPGLRVYQNNYRSTLIACLEASFDKTRAWIGQEAFLFATVSHIERLPPSSWTLDAYARDFPTTLAFLHPNNPEVGELAWIELALSEAFVGPDTSALAIEDLADVDWDRALLHTTPTLDIGALTTNAVAIWSAIDAGDPVPAAASLSICGAVLVWRQDHASRFRATDCDEAQALIQTRRELSFEALCKGAVEAFGEGAGIERAGKWLGRWISDGLITGIDHGPKDT